MLAEDFHDSLEYWLKALDKYDFENLCMQPSDKCWSVGHICMHLIDNTSYFIQQAIVCTTHDDNGHEEKTEFAKEMFANNAFPDLILEGPPSNACTQKPESKEEIIAGFKRLHKELDKAIYVINQAKHHGKTKHIGLHYFNAHEWLQFAEMHLRHHIRQKNRIDEFLANNQ